MATPKKTQSSTAKTSKSPKMTYDVSDLLNTVTGGCPQDLAAAQAKCKELSQLCLDRDRLILARDNEIKQVTDTYAATIEEHDGLIDRIAKQLKMYATKKRPELFGDKQTFVCAAVALSWQKSPGALATEKGKKEADIVDYIIASGDTEAINRYILLNPKLNKVLLKQDLEKGGELAKKVKSYGLYISEPEFFSATPQNREELNATITA